MSRTKDSVDYTLEMVYETGSDEPPSMAVVTAVAEAMNRSVTELDPLYRAIDSDALDTILGTNGRGEAAVTLSFDYCGCRVTASPGEIRIDRSE